MLDTMHALLRGPSYRAFFEIQTNRAREEVRDSKGFEKWSVHVATRIGRARKQGFANLGLPTAKLNASRSFSFMVLSGIASQSMLFPGADTSKQHLAALRDHLVRSFSSD